MKMICIKGNIPGDGYASPLTKGKIYELQTRPYTSNTWFVDDIYCLKIYNERYESFFMELDQYRNVKLNELLT